MLTFASEHEVIDAQLRYKEIMKQEIDNLKVIEQEELRYMKVERQLLLDVKSRNLENIKNTITQNLVKLYKETGRPVDINEVSRRCREHKIDVWEVCIKLEERGIQATYYVDEKPVTDWKPPPEILKIRKKLKGMKDVNNEHG